jgi:hypothetical protein
MKTKKRRQSRKKRVGGASGLVLIVDYDKSGNIKNMKLQNMLARHEYMNRNKIDPSPSISDGFRELFNLDRMQQAFRDFLNLPGDESEKRKTQKKRIVKIAVNDKPDIVLIQLVNKVINRLNGIKNKRSQEQLFIIRDTAGKLTNKTKLEFRKRYEELLAGAFIEDYKNEKKTEVDEELLKRLMRMPVLMNVVSIKYGLLNRGDMKLEELQDIYNLDNGRILDLVKLEKKARPNVVTYDQIIEEENEKLAKENRDLQEKLNNLKANKAPEPELVVLEELGEKPIEELAASSAAPSAGTSTAGIPAAPSAGTSTAATSSAAIPAGIPVAGPSSATSSTAPSSAGPSAATSSTAPSSASSVSPSTGPSASGPVVSPSSREEAINTFNNLLKTKYGGSVDKINQNEEELKEELKTTKLDRVKLMQYYLIKNILVCIGVDERNLYENERLKKDISKRQATILLLIRFLLTKDMKDFDKFKKEFDIVKLCNTSKIAANEQSGILGQFARQIGFNSDFSYDKIIKNIVQLCPDQGQKGVSPNYDAMITIHLNKLYDLFQTKDPAYIQDMVSKSYGNTVTTVGDYNETYDQAVNCIQVSKKYQVRLNGYWAMYVRTGIELDSPVVYTLNEGDVIEAVGICEYSGNTRVKLSDGNWTTLRTASKDVFLIPFMDTATATGSSGSSTTHSIAPSPLSSISYKATETQPSSIHRSTTNTGNPNYIFS